jgi:hypothetical protein
MNEGPVFNTAICEGSKFGNEVISITYRVKVMDLV